MRDDQTASLVGGIAVRAGGHGRPRSSAATEPAYEVVRVTVKEEKRVTASGAKDQKEAEPESSEYTYEYESASPKMETDDAKKG